MADSLEHRVLAAAKAALDQTRYVAPIDVLTRLGWLRAARRSLAARLRPLP
jgi:hypothetical protein